jgi:predicted transposase YbfD/YdcC
VEHAQELIELLQLERQRIPSPATFYRVLRQVNVAELEQQIAAYGQCVNEQECVADSMELPNGERICGQAMDGKAVRGANAHGEQVHLLSLVSHGSGITLGQQQVERKTNEIGAAPPLLADRDLAGIVITADALHTQRSLAQQILDQNGDYLMVVKKNQGQLWAALDLLFQSAPWPQDKAARLTYAYTQKGHGRIETRTLVTSTQLNDYLAWPGLQQVMQRTCRRLIVTTGEIQTETTYGITSLTQEQVQPKHLEQLWRGHWTIENRDHYVRDETMGEDRGQVHTGNAPQALAALRNGILTALRYRGWHNIAEAMRHFGASVQRALTLVGAIST